MATPAKNVIVIGAGVSGLTTGICLAEAGWTVRVVAENPPDQTTSAVAGASWGPYMCTDARVLPWSDRTLTELEAIAAVGPSTGVRLVHGLEVAREHAEPPDWARRIAGFRMCEPPELPAGYSCGWRYRIPIVDMPVYLHYLRGRLAAAGTTVEIATVNSFDEIADRAPVIVNCTGLGARALVPDLKVSATRGQLVVAENPGVDYFFQDDAEEIDLTYFLPHGDRIVLGGSALPDAREEEYDPAIAEAIIARCAQIEPRLRRPRVLEHRVGFRPMRPEVRVEQETVAGVPVVHNYGHGGSGLTLSWGCALEVLEQLAAV
jgi:D-amino-acid oxidase